MITVRGSFAVKNEKKRSRNVLNHVGGKLFKIKKNILDHLGRKWQHKEAKMNELE